jgi:hypothetical protein
MPSQAKGHLANKYTTLLSGIRIFITAYTKALPWNFGTKKTHGFSPQRQSEFL